MSGFVKEHLLSEGTFRVIIENVGGLSLIYNICESCNRDVAFRESGWLSVTLLITGTA